MAMLSIERRFLTAFAEAVLGLEHHELGQAAKAVDRLDKFLDHSSFSLRFTFHLALLVMPGGLLTKLRFAGKPLAWRRNYLDRLFLENIGRAPGWMVDAQGVLATVKSMVSGSFCELPEFWERIGYRSRPGAFPVFDGVTLVPPSGPEVEPKEPSAAGKLLKERVGSLAGLPEKFPGEETILIIGAGGAGLAAAHALVSRPEGRAARIILLESGALHTNEAFPRTTLDGFSQLYVNSGVTPGKSQRIGFIQGRCVGGGTTVNNAGSPQPKGPWADIMHWRWGSEGADLDWSGLDRAFDELRDPLHIRVVDQRILTTGTKRAFSGFGEVPGSTYAGLLQANLEDCISCGQCNQGCPYDAHRAPFITLLPDQRVQSALRLMQKNPDEPVTSAVAREICQRTGSKATVEGSITQLGTAYVIAIGVHNCATGAPLAQQQVQAPSKEAVLATLGSAVTDLRQELGESLASIKKYDVPVTEATTGSLEALRAYGLANKTRYSKGDEAAIPFFQKAIELDPNFALAYAKLGVMQSNIGRTAEAAANAAKAYEFKDRVSEYERLYIIWNHATRVLHDKKLAFDTLQLMTTSSSPA